MEPQFTARIGHTLNRSAIPQPIAPGCPLLHLTLTHSDSNFSLPYSQQTFLCSLNSHRTELLLKYLCGFYLEDALVGTGGRSHLFYIVNSYVRAINMAP